MKKVCVITGGGSGMGLATAKVLGKDYFIVIAGRTVKKLEGAVQELHNAGIEVEAVACDVSDRASVDQLAAHAKAKGPIAVVVHSAGISPRMGGGTEALMRINALGTINLNEAFHDLMEKGSCMIDIASMSGYFFSPTEADMEIYQLSRSDKGQFIEKAMEKINQLPESSRAGMAYVMSKNFVIWYAKADAAKFGEKGARVISISPGTFETPMNDAEKESTDNYIPHCAIKRLGRVEEIADLIAFCASEKASYLTGTDILCDGGFVASGFVNSRR